MAAGEGTALRSFPTWKDFRALEPDDFMTHSLPAAGITRLDRRTRHGRVGTIDTAVAGEGL